MSFVILPPQLLGDRLGNGVIKALEPSDILEYQEAAVDEPIPIKVSPEFLGDDLNEIVLLFDVEHRCASPISR
jgi:hypothetical protein